MMMRVILEPLNVEPYLPSGIVSPFHRCAAEALFEFLSAQNGF